MPDRTLSAEVRAVTSELEVLTKRIAGAIRSDECIYISPKEISIPALASSIMFNLIRARQDAAALLDLSGE